MNIDSGPLTLKPPLMQDPEQALELIPLAPEPEINPSKPGNKPKQLVRVETLGYSISTAIVNFWTAY